MNPELEQQIRALIRDELSNMIKLDRYVFDKHIQILDARNIQLPRTNGTMIGTAADQKLAFYGATPIVRQAAITAPSGGSTIDSQARNSINGLITALQKLGLTE